MSDEESSSHTEEKLLTDPHEHYKSKDECVSKGASLKSSRHNVIEVWSSNLSSCVLVYLDGSLNEFTSDLLILVSWVVDSSVEELVNLHETKEGDHNKHDVGEALTGDVSDHGHDEAVGIIYPNEVVYLVKALVQKDSLE